MECVPFDHIKRRRFGQTLRNKWRFSCASRFPEPFLSCFEWTCSFMEKSVKSGRIVNQFLASQSKRRMFFFLSGIRDRPWLCMKKHVHTHISKHSPRCQIKCSRAFQSGILGCIEFTSVSWHTSGAQFWKTHWIEKKYKYKTGSPKISVNRACQFTFWNSWQKHWPPLLAGFHSKYVLKELKETQWPPVPETHKCLKHMHFSWRLARSLW